MKLKKFYLSLIRAYQKSWFYRTPILKTLFLTDASCRFRPTCSEYTYEAVNRYGIIVGSLKGLRRILRCHPWNKGGNDPLE